ncbi:hypothetical protein [Granulicella arctica]|uniref:hypothetical protein n=1 Tax=Granulicella arctica TaxID=940613 RepID=UPI0021DFA1D5|nr:hypothetical protein [Granulicella arctica]
MNRILARLHLRLYPRRWRTRYGEEFEEFLYLRPAGLRTSADLVRSAFSELISPTFGADMTKSPQTFSALSKQPSAFLPLTMSLLALATMALGPWVFGDFRAKDEGPTAHIWQILIAGQLPVIAFFAFKWLRRLPGQAVKVLSVQASAVLVNFAVVFLMGVG